MNDAESCESCGASDPIPGLDPTLCEECILKALAARFPIGNLSLDALAAALKPAPSVRARVRRAPGA